MPPLALSRNLPDALRSRSDDRNTSEGLELYVERRASSLCGAKITVSCNGQRRYATIGGLVAIDGGEGSSQILGITAGHFLGKQQYLDKEAQEEDIDEDFDDTQEFELDLGELTVGDS